MKERGKKDVSERETAIERKKERKKRLEEERTSEKERQRQRERERERESGVCVCERSWLFVVGTHRHGCCVQWASLAVAEISEAQGTG